jgi:hypothetical protein
VTDSKVPFGTRDFKLRRLAGVSAGSAAAAAAAAEPKRESAAEILSPALRDEGSLPFSGARGRIRKSLSEPGILS